MTQKQRGEVIAILAFLSKALVLGGFLPLSLAICRRPGVSSWWAAGVLCLGVAYRLAGALED